MTSRNCLSSRFAGTDLGDALGELFAERQAIVADYIDNDPNFGAYPGEDTPGQSFPILDNEHFAPLVVFMTIMEASSQSLSPARTVDHHNASNKVYRIRKRKF